MNQSTKKMGHHFDIIVGASMLHFYQGWTTHGPLPLLHFIKLKKNECSWIIISMHASWYRVLALISHHEHILNNNIMNK